MCSKAQEDIKLRLSNVISAVKHRKESIDTWGHSFSYHRKLFAENVLYCQESVQYMELKMNDDDVDCIVE